MSSSYSSVCPQIPSSSSVFNEFWRTWKDDFEMQAQKRNQELSEEQLRTMVLLDIELRLQSFEKSLEDFGLPVDEKYSNCLKILGKFFLDG